MPLVAVECIKDSLRHVRFVPIFSDLRYALSTLSLPQFPEHSSHSFRLSLRHFLAHRSIPLFNVDTPGQDNDQREKIVLIERSAPCRRTRRAKFMARVETYEVRFRLAPSQGGKEEAVMVQADDTPSAIMKAALKLDQEGKTHWLLLRCSKVTS